MTRRPLSADTRAEMGYVRPTAPDFGLWAPQPTEAHARTSDPETSKRAAKKLSEQAISRLQWRIIGILANATEQGMTHDQLIACYASGTEGNKERFPKRSPQSIRSRCADLARIGYVIPNGDDGTHSYWKLSPHGVAASLEKR